MSELPTPETDAFIASQNHSPTTHQLRNFARIFERERDEARNECDKLKQLLAADSENVDAYLGVCMERDEAREALDCLLTVIGLTPIAGHKEALQEAFDQGLAVLRKQEEAK